MPPQYKFSLYEMMASCSLIGFDFVASCMIGSQNRMDVFLNGSTIDMNKEYTIILENVNSPNEDVSSYTVISFLWEFNQIIYFYKKGYTYKLFQR